MLREEIQYSMISVCDSMTNRIRSEMSVNEVGVRRHNTPQMVVSEEEDQMRRFKDKPITPAPNRSHDQRIVLDPK
jgi:hypothetical protein